MAIINEGMGGLNELSYLIVENIKVPEKEVLVLHEPEPYF